MFMTEGGSKKKKKGSAYQTISATHRVSWSLQQSWITYTYTTLSFVQIFTKLSCQNPDVWETEYLYEILSKLPTSNETL